MKKGLFGSQHGSLTLELAFIVPVMMMLVLGSISLGISLIDKSVIRDASFVGARSISSTGVDSEQVRKDIQVQLADNFIAGPDSVLVRISYLDVNGMDYSLEQPASDTVVDYPVAAGAGEQLRVELTSLDYVLDLPFISSSVFDMRGVSVSRNSVAP